MTPICTIVKFSTLLFLVIPFLHNLQLTRFFRTSGFIVLFAQFVNAILPIAELLLLIILLQLYLCNTVQISRMIIFVLYPSNAH